MRVHQTGWEGRQRIPIVGSRMGKRRSKHAHFNQGFFRDEGEHSLEKGEEEGEEEKTKEG